MNVTSLHPLLMAALSVLAIYLTLVLIMFLSQKSLIYHPDNSMPQPAQYGVDDAKIISVKTSDGLNLKGWYQPPSKKDAPIMIIFHGNAGHIGYRAHLMRIYAEKGLGVVLAEYRGYGGNPGYPHEKGLYTDAFAYIDFIQKHRDLQGRDIVLYGESLGTGVAIEAARHYNIAALILEAPYDSFTELAKTHYSFIPFVSHLVSEKYESIEKIHDLKIPKLFLVAGQDTIIPEEHAQRLYDKASRPKEKVIFPLAHHNNFYDYKAEIAVLRFLDKHIVYKYQ